MDSSSPSPSRSGRELLVLLVVVVIGAVLALVIEHAIGAMRDRSESSADAARIEPELNADMEFLAERALGARCLGHRLDVLEAKLLAADGHWTPIAPATDKGMQAGEVLPIPLRPWSTAGWSATDPAPLGDAQRALYTGLYQRIDRAATMNADEFVAMAGLNVLAKPVTLSGDGVVALVGQIEAERARNRLFAANAIEAVQAWSKGGHDQAALLKAISKTSPLLKACSAGAAPQPAHN